MRKDGYKRFETTLSKNTTDKELSVSLDPEEGAQTISPPPEDAVQETPPEPKVEPKPEPVVSRPKPQPPKVEPKVEPPVEKFSPPEEAYTPPPQPKSSSFVAGNGPPGIIFMSSSPARADIVIDGKDTGKKTPAKLELPSGVHRIEMLKGGQKASTEQMVNEGKNKAVHLNLQ